MLDVYQQILQSKTRTYLLYITQLSVPKNNFLDTFSKDRILLRLNNNTDHVLYLQILEEELSKLSFFIRLSGCYSSIRTFKIRCKYLIYSRIFCGNEILPHVAYVLPLHYHLRILNLDELDPQKKVKLFDPLVLQEQFSLYYFV